jgi:nucleoside-diphosphate-sugar epimerase
VDWIYVADVADGLLALAVAEGIDGQTIDLGSGKLITVRNFVEQLSELIPSSVELQFAAIPDRPLERVAVADVENTMMKTGWRATTAPHDGMRATIQWCREMIESPVSVG